MVVLSNFVAPQEGVRHEESNTTVYVGDREIGNGTLYVTESMLSWVNDITQQGFSLEYPHISLHAISRDQMVHPRPCLYVLVDAAVDLPASVTSDAQSAQNHYASNNENDEDGDKDDNEEPDPPITDIVFAPNNINNLESMFQAMSQCQALHPDPQDSFSDAEEDIYEDAEDDDFEYYEVGAGDAPYIMPTEQIINHNGTDVEESMDVEAGQFEDAEEDP